MAAFQSNKLTTDQTENIAMCEAFCRFWCNVWKILSQSMSLNISLTSLGVDRNVSHLILAATFQRRCLIAESFPGPGYDSADITLHDFLQRVLSSPRPGMPCTSSTDRISLMSSDTLRLDTFISPRTEAVFRTQIDINELRLTLGQSQLIPLWTKSLVGEHQSLCEHLHLSLITPEATLTL